MASSNLLAPKLPQSRTEALRWYAGLKSHAAAAGKWETRVDERDGTVYPGVKAWLGRHDLYFLIVFLLHRAGDMCPRPLGKATVKKADWLFERCREIQAEPDGFIDLWAREHYKSTIITFGLTIQDLLNDVEETFGIFADVNKTAKAFLRQIMRELEFNGELKAAYPDVLWAEPRTDAPKWSEQDGIILKRKGNPKEASVEAYGLIDGQPTGRHFGKLVFDDLVTVETVHTEGRMDTVRSRWELADNLGVEGGIKRIQGTRYHLFDVYRTILDRGTAKPRIKPCTDNGKEDGEPVMMARDEIARRRRDQGPYTFGAQMLLDPQADETQGFKEAWLRYWPAEKFDNLNLYMVIDPSGGKRAGTQGKKGTGDYTSIWIVGAGADGNLYICDLLRDRLNLTGRCRAVMALHRKWHQPSHRILAVGYEEYGMQADREALAWLQERENYRFDTVALAGTKITKQDRIRRLVPWHEQGRVYYPQHGIVKLNAERQMVDMLRLYLNEEYLAFPLAAHDDGLDSLSRVLDDEIGMTSELAPLEQGSGIDKDGYSDEPVSETGWMAG